MEVLSTRFGAGTASVGVGELRELPLQAMSPVEASLALSQVQTLRRQGSAILELAVRCFLPGAYLDSSA